MKDRYFLIGTGLVLATVLAGVVAYPHLPAMVPSHWNAHGQVNGYAPRWTIPVLIPAIMTVVMLVYAALPWLSPKQFEVAAFRSTYEFIMLATVGFLTYIQGLMIWAAVSGHVDVGRAVLGGVCLLIALIGNVLGRVRRNFYVGIRTPWTLANERVWNATHRWAAKAFTAAGLVGLGVVVLTNNAYLLLVVIILPSIASAIYSLVIYKSLQRRGEI